MSPSTYHCANKELHSYYMRYLIQQALAQFDWELPPEWKYRRIWRWLIGGDREEALPGELRPAKKLFTMRR